MTEQPSDELDEAIELDHKFVLPFNCLSFVLLLVRPIKIGRRLYLPLGLSLCQKRQEMKS